MVQPPTAARLQTLLQNAVTCGIDHELVELVYPKAEHPRFTYDERAHQATQEIEAAIEAVAAALNDWRVAGYLRTVLRLDEKALGLSMHDMWTKAGSYYGVKGSMAKKPPYKDELLRDLAEALHERLK